MRNKLLAATAAFTFATTAFPAMAQTTVNDASGTTVPADNDDDGDSGKWGLLGLLGLAGLMGLKRRDRDDHVRTNTTGNDRR